MASISFVSINVERSKHLALVIPFLTGLGADVICMQELAERDIPNFEAALGMKCVFAPCGVHISDGESPSPLIGIGIFTALPISSTNIQYYDGSEEQARKAPAHEIFIDNPIIAIDIEKEGTTFRIMTTHFTWTPNGLPNDRQYEVIPRLMDMLAKAGEFVFCTDLNAPRGGPIFKIIAEAYRDNIPSQYTTSLDPARHRAPLDEQAGKMVDGLFTTPTYQAADVALHAGVSDHLAVTATISRTS